MTDYTFDTGVLRGQMANALADNVEQFAYVVAGAMEQVAADDIIEVGRLPSECDKELVVHNLRLLASAIESGSIE